MTQRNPVSQTKTKTNQTKETSHDCEINTRLAFFVRKNPTIQRGPLGGLLGPALINDFPQQLGAVRTHWLLLLVLSHQLVDLLRVTAWRGRNRI